MGKWSIETGTPDVLRGDLIAKYRPLIEAVERNTREEAAHDSHHCWLVWRHVCNLAQELQASGQQVDLEALLVATFTHDSGRIGNNLRGMQSINASIDMLKCYRLDCGLPRDVVAVAEGIILEHDNPDIEHTTIEAQILAEADFLAGLGAWGVFRTLTHAGSRKRGFEAILKMFIDGMPKRVKSLKFEYSREIAWKTWAEVKFWLEMLKEEYRPQEETERKGVYIVVEGLSGSGKGTQIELLEQRLEREGLSVLVVTEPTDEAREVVKLYQRTGKLSERQRALIYAMDRERVMEQVAAALADGKVVLAGRNFISSMAYQGSSGEISMAEVALFNREALRPDMVIFLRTDSAQSIARVDHRLATAGGTRGDYEQVETMRRLASGYEAALAELCPVVPVVVEEVGDQTPGRVFDQVWGSVQEVVEKVRRNSSDTSL